MKLTSFANRLLTLVLLSITVFFNASSQSRQDIFNRTGPEIVWLGLDFTQIKLIGPLGTVDKDEIVPLFDDINRVVITERSKYNFEAALRKDKVPFNLEIVTRLNSGIRPEEVIVYNSSNENSNLNEESVSVLVKQYNVPGKEGIGLVFFMESFDKYRETGTMWVTFFSLSDRNVLFTERMSGPAGGISFRNHWARTIFEVIDQIRNSKFAEWRFRYVN
jgi:hypothetical protein